jgi:hypothetical protein
MIQYLRTSLKASHCNGLAKSVNRIFCKKSEISQKGGIAESDGLSGDTDSNNLNLFAPVERSR